MVKTGMTVIQFKSGVSIETLERDEDYRTGRITTILVNRVRIAWDRDDAYIWVNSDMLTKADKDTVIYTVPLNSDTSDN